jgi:hypothetical protein
VAAAEVQEPLVAPGRIPLQLAVGSGELVYTILYLVRMLRMLVVGVALDMVAKASHRGQVALVAVALEVQVLEEQLVL